MEVPAVVYVIWWVTLIVAVVVVLPLAVYLLHRTLVAARQIERYAARALEAGFHWQMSKPVEPSQVVGILASLIGHVAPSADSPEVTG